MDSFLNRSGVHKMSNTEHAGTCCMCCGIPLKNTKYFEKEDGTLVRCTIDHVLLRSLNGSNSIDNLVLMCHDCNQMRGNLFAELDEFIFWYWSGEDLPKEKNFSYLRNKPRKKENNLKHTFVNNVFVRVSPELIFEHYNSNIKPSNSHYTPVEQVKETKSGSVLIGTLESNGFIYEEYKHPVYGKSLVKVGKCLVN